ncbi:hypothetical protein CBW52_17435 [Yersinia kristensenii]|uniref:Uncharacterized protein n=1 Tax=Yersinia kristensenii TaxID=28152 RepID=A0AB73NH66_YERKR|nr:hypothetical protein CBW52_17435 [Yersinia kristensenii]
MALKSIDSSGLTAPHSTGSINAVQIGSRPICLSLTAFMKLELFRLYLFILLNKKIILQISF